MQEGYFVTDQHDPAGQGMFSKAGRFTSEKYIIFQRKEEILHNKKPMRISHSQPLLPSAAKQGLTGDKAGAAAAGAAAAGGQGAGKGKDDKLAQVQSEKEKQTPFYKQLSREKVDQVKSVKVITKPLGTYKPTYNQIDRAPHLVWNILKVYNTRTLPRPVAQQEPNVEEELTRPIPERPHTHTKGLIELDRCLSRNESIMYNQRDNPHPMRFQRLYMSQTWSKIPRIPQFDLQKSHGREDNKVYGNKEHQPDYNPNYEFGRRQLGSSGPAIHTRPPRRPFHRISATNNEDFYNFDMYVRQTNSSQVFQNVPNLDINRMLPREIDPASPLPSFMQKHVNTRGTLTGLHHKMLEQNHFFEGRFQSTLSDFNKTTSRYQKNKRLDDEEDESIEFENAPQQQQQQQA